MWWIIIVIDLTTRKHLVALDWLFIYKENLQIQIKELEPSNLWKIISIDQVTGKNLAAHIIPGLLLWLGKQPE